MKTKGRDKLALVSPVTESTVEVREVCEEMSSKKDSASGKSQGLKFVGHDCIYT